MNLNHLTVHTYCILQNTDAGFQSFVFMTFSWRHTGDAGAALVTTDGANNLLLSELDRHRGQDTQLTLQHEHTHNVSFSFMCENKKPSAFLTFLYNRKQKNNLKEIQSDKNIFVF